MCLLAIVACFLLLSGRRQSWTFLFLTARGRLAHGRILATCDLRLCPFAVGTSLLWFAVEMYMLFFFGREVERFIGHRAFIILYLVLLWCRRCFCRFGGVWNRCGIAGSATLHFGIFIAFAAIYPNVELLLRIQAKWMALALAGISTLAVACLSEWSTMTVLWLSIAVAFFFIRLRGVGPELVWWNDLSVAFPKEAEIPCCPSSRITTQRRFRERP